MLEATTIMRTLAFLTLIALSYSYSTVAAPSSLCRAVQPQPTGSCGIRGRIKYKYSDMFDSTALPQIVDSVKDCAELCARRVESRKLDQINGYGNYGLDTYCESFKFNLKTNLCQFGQFPIMDRVNPEPNSSWVFYDPNCFKCGAPCPQPYGAQILDNGRFEDDLLGPWAIFDYGERTNNLGKGYNSRFSFHSSHGAALQEVNLCHHNLYGIEFDYVALKTSNKSPAELVFSFGGDTNTYGFNSREKTGLFSNTILSNNTNRRAWHSKRLYFPYRVGEHKGPEFNFGGRSGAGSFYIDNVRVARVPPNPRIRTGASSLLVNGGWETGTIDGWTYRDVGFYTRNYTVVSPGINSDFALEYRATYNNIHTAEGPYLSQTVATRPNTTYIFRFDAQVKYNEMEFYLTIGPPEDLLEYSEYYLPGNHTFSVPVFAQTDSLKIEFQTGYFQQSGHGKMLMDNFKFLELANSRFFP